MEAQVACTGIRGTLRLEDILYQARKSSRIGPVQAVRAEVVVGLDHVRSAALHAARARAEGRAQADREEVEFLRYLSGEPQIQKALAKCGLPAVSSEAVAIALGPRADDALRHFVHALGLEEDPSLVRADEERLRAFGITDVQLAATTPGRRLDLVLEAVAAVDL